MDLTVRRLRHGRVGVFFAARSLRPGLRCAVAFAPALDIPYTGPGLAVIHRERDAKPLAQTADGFRPVASTLELSNTKTRCPPASRAICTEALLLGRTVRTGGVQMQPSVDFAAVNPVARTAAEERQQMVR